MINNIFNGKPRTIIPVALALLILLPFCFIACYNHPALDDWWYAEAYKQHGLWGTQAYWYNQYTARFFSSFIMSLQPLNFGCTIGHKILPIIFLFALYATSLRVINTFYTPANKQKYLIALWATAAYLLIQRDYFESLYWLAANVVYQYAFLLFIVHITVLYKAKFHPTFAQNIIIGTSAIAVTASNEIFGGLLLIECILLIAYAWLKKITLRLPLLLLALLAVTWAIMFAAPGNWSKIQDAKQEHAYIFSLLTAVKHSIISAGYYVVFLLKQLHVWCLLLLMVPVCRQVYTKVLGKEYTYLIPVFGLVAFSLAGIIYFISIYPTGILIPPLRVSNIAIVFLFTGITLLLYFVSEIWVTFNRCVNFLCRKKVYVLVVCVLAASILPTKFNNLLSDICTGKASAYNAAMHHRYQLLRNCSSDTCFVPALTNVPRTIVATDVSGSVSQRIGLVFNKKNVVIISSAK